MTDPSPDDTDIFVINLDRNPERLALVAADAEQVGLTFTRVRATDLADLDPPAVEQLVTDGLVLRDAADRLVPGTLGCALSHRAAYREMVDRGLRAAIVLEDDVLLTSEAGDAFRSMLRTIEPGEVILFYYRYSYDGELRVDPPAPPRSDRFTLYEPHGYVVNGAVAYAIAADVAERLAGVNYPVRFPADEWVQYYDAGAFDRLFVVYPHVVEHRLGQSTRAPRSGSTANLKAKISFGLLRATTKVRGGKHPEPKVLSKRRVPVVVPRDADG